VLDDFKQETRWYWILIKATGANGIVWMHRFSTSFAFSHLVKSYADFIAFRDKLISNRHHGKDPINLGYF
jgi:hypothetical protein